MKANWTTIVCIAGLVIGTTARGADQLTEAYADQTIVYTQPRPVYDDDGNVDHYENTYEEQRNNHIRAIEATYAGSNAQAAQQNQEAQQASAQTEAAGRASVANSQSQADTTQAAATTAKNNSNQADPGVTSAAARITTLRGRNPLSKIDINGDGEVSASERAAIQRTRPSVKAQQFSLDGQDRKLDANGDGSFNVSEGSAGVGRTAWDGSDDGLAAKNARVSGINSEKAQTQAQSNQVESQRQAATAQMQQQNQQNQQNQRNQ